MENDQLVASVDLGSNSFHMLVARIHAGQVQVVDRMKEMVRLAGGLDEDGRLTEASMERALDCLRRFGQRLRDMPPGSVRVVGTNTLRRAKNGRAFVRRAELAIGHPVEIIAGREEARLVYLGVAHSDVPVDGRRLVVDIGGGSTELIIGERFDPVQMESVPLGCVSVTRAHFATTLVDEGSLRRAEQWARLELAPFEKAFRHRGWVRALGSSGSARSLGAVSAANGWSDGTITVDSLAEIRKAILKAGRLDKLDLQGLSQERRPVFVGGFVVMQAVFEALRIDEMHISDGALREGLIYDWLGREKQDDVRSTTVRRLQEMFTVDRDHAERVCETADLLFEKVRQDWKLERTDRTILSVASSLHEIGLAISHSGYHHHGAYVLENADMPGLTRSAQQWVATLVRAHRRKFKANRFELIEEGERSRAMRLTVLLRLAALLHRNRSRRLQLPEMALQVKDRKIDMVFPANWLERHPLTATDLEREKAYLSMLDFELSFR
ncbi:MAG: exopolyphosphatase [Halothiobacillaceae bacterium]